MGLGERVIASIKRRAYISEEPYKHPLVGDITEEEKKTETITRQAFTITTSKQELSQLFNFFDMSQLTVDDSLQICHRLLATLGFNMLDPNFHKKWTQKFWTYINFIYMCIFIFANFMYIRANIRDVDLVSECAATFVLSMLLMEKFLFFLFNKELIADMISRYRFIYYYHMAEGGPEKKLVYWKCLEGRIITRVFYLICVPAAIGFACYPMFINVHHQLPLPARLYDFWQTDKTKDTHFLKNYALQGYGCMFAINLFCGLSGFCINFMLCIAAKLAVIRHRILNFGVGKKFYKMETMDEFYDLSMIDNEYGQKYLGECIQIQQSAYNLIEEFNALYTNDFFGEVMLLGLIGCMSLYQVSQKSGMDLVPYVMYLVAVIVEMFVYCWYGELIHTYSEYISEAIWEVPWYKCDRSLRSTVHFMLMRAQNSIELNAIFFTLRLDSFANRIKNMYSFYAIMVKNR